MNHVFRLSRSHLVICLGRSVSTARTLGNKTFPVWKPAALTALVSYEGIIIVVSVLYCPLQVGGVTCCASGVYATEWNLKWRRLWKNEGDGWLEQVLFC